MPRDTFTYSDQQLVKKLILELDPEAVVDSASRDAKTRERKDDIWELVTDQFNDNSKCGFYATTKQLRELYTRIKFQQRQSGVVDYKRAEINSEIREEFRREVEMNGDEIVTHSSVRIKPDYDRVESAHGETQNFIAPEAHFMDQGDHDDEESVQEECVPGKRVISVSLSDMMGIPRKSAKKFKRDASPNRFRALRQARVQESERASAYMESEDARAQKEHQQTMRVKERQIEVMEAEETRQLVEHEKDMQLKDRQMEVMDKTMEFLQAGIDFFRRNGGQV